MCLNTSAALCSARTCPRAASISSLRSALNTDVSGSASPPGGSERYGVSLPTSWSWRRDSLWRMLRQVFTAILCSQVLKALSPLKVFMFLQTRIQTSWLASWASSLPSMRSETLYTRPEWASTSFVKASTSPREARAPSPRSPPVLTRGQPSSMLFGRSPVASADWISRALSGSWPRAGCPPGLGCDQHHSFRRSQNPLPWSRTYWTLKQVESVTPHPLGRRQKHHSR
jgi:hypothetical protein